MQDQDGQNNNLYVDCMITVVWHMNLRPASGRQALVFNKLFNQLVNQYGTMQIKPWPLQTSFSNPLFMVSAISLHVLIPSN